MRCPQLIRGAANAMQMLLPIRGATHVDRLNYFYGRQAKNYDAFRPHLLHGRDLLWQSIFQTKPGIQTWIDFGGGTAANFAALGTKIQDLNRIEIVDPCTALTQVARRRIEENAWSNARVVDSDATSYKPADQADVVTFSYSLSMIPDWYAAIENAASALRPGGLIGVVDFYVSRKHAGEEMRQHGLATRTFWPAWFQSDNVFPSADHLPYLQSRFETIWLDESRGKIPFVPLLRAPYYSFIGRKR